MSKQVVAGYGTFSGYYGKPKYILIPHHAMPQIPHGIFLGSKHTFYLNNFFLCIIVSLCIYCTFCVINLFPLIFTKPILNFDSK